MAKFLKGLLIALLVLGGLLLLALVVLPSLIDPNNYKDEIVSSLSEETGHQIQIDGELKLSVFPWLGIETSGVSVSNPPGFGEQPLAKVRELGLKVRLMPLFSNRLEVDTLLLDGLQLNLQRNAQGQGNWESGRAKPAGEAEQAKPSAAETGMAFVVQGVQLSDASVDWRDLRSGEHYQLSDLQLESGSLAPEAEVPVKLSFQLLREQPSLQALGRLQMKVTVDAEFQRLSFEDVEIDLQAKGAQLPAAGVEMALRTAAVLDLGADSLRLDDLRLRGEGLDLSGRLAVQQMRTRQQLSGELKLAQTNLKKLAALFGNPLQTRDEAVLQRVSAQIGIAGEDGAIRLEPLAVDLDDSLLRGHVHLIDPAGPVVRAKLAIDTLNVDRYLAPPAQAAGSPQAGAAGGAAGNPLAALLGLDLKADLSIDQLVVGGARMSQVKMSLLGRNGVLQLDPLSAALYQGSLQGSISVDARSSKPKFKFSNTLSNIAMEPLLVDLADRQRLVGTANLQLDLQTSGLDEAALRRGLNGSGSFKLTDGAYRGVNIARLIRVAANRLGLSDQPPPADDSQTDFSELSGTLTVVNGVLNNPDLLAKSPLLRINGSGKVDLNSEQIDYSLTTVLVRSLEGQGGAERDKLAGVPIPVRIEGAMVNPSYRPDLQAALQGSARQRIEEEASRALERGLQRFLNR